MYSVTIYTPYRDYAEAHTLGVGGTYGDVRRQGKEVLGGTRLRFSHLHHNDKMVALYLICNSDISLVPDDCDNLL